MSLERIHKIHNELEPYIELMNDEYGEYLSSLLELSRYVDFLPIDLQSHLMQQLEKELDNVKQHCTIVVSKETVTRTYRGLEWVNYDD